jgi:hypothetical protein
MEAGMGFWTRDERTTVELSFLSLAGFWLSDASETVEAAGDIVESLLPRQEIVWGPAAHQPPAGGCFRRKRPTDALVLVCRDLDTGAHNVVLRGTNPISAMEWMAQDFQVRKMIGWSELRPGPAPADAMISEGTASAISLRLAMRPEAGSPGEGVSLERELVGILERSEGPCVLRFTGHSLGGLLASAMALWLVDYLDAEGRGDLRGKLSLEVYAYAGPTAGNGAFAAYLESRLSGGILRRYASDLDVAPIAWEEEAMRGLPELYLPEIRMDALTMSFYKLFMILAKGQGYDQPGERILVPSRIVPARGGVYLLEAAYQHSVPYLDLLLPERKERILREVIEPIASLVTVKGMKKLDIRALYAAR